MVESLLSGSAILMYGRVMRDITLVQATAVPPPPPPPAGTDTHPPTTSQLNFLQRQLDAGDPKLARIYAFSSSGAFYSIATPVIILVHGDGDPAGAGLPGLGAFRGPGGADVTGVAAQDYDFTADMRMWTYDKNDISLRLDLSTGMLEDILLAAELDDDGEHPTFGGGRVGGGRVGGGRVGGGRVGGGRVGGGRVGGGRVGGG